MLKAICAREAAVGSTSTSQRGLVRNVAGASTKEVAHVAKAEPTKKLASIFGPFRNAEGAHSESSTVVKVNEDAGEVGASWKLQSKAGST